MTFFSVVKSSLRIAGRSRWERCSIVRSVNSGQHVRVVRGHFLRCERVVARAELVEDAVDVFPAVFLRALEHHVLEEVRDAVDVDVLVARPGLARTAGGEGVESGLTSAMMSRPLESWACLNDRAMLISFCLWSPLPPGEG
jgi:hypothetical protein